MTIPGIRSPAIPYGSLVIVSGVSGLIGSHIADQAVAAGFKVRGTTRSVEKNAWIVNHFKERYGPDNFELVEVPDMGAEGAFDEVVKGAAGFVHVANDMTGSNNPDVAVPLAVNGALNALKASAKEPNMRRFVYTSSSWAVTLPKPGKKFTVTQDTFNDEAVRRIKEPDPDGPSVYAASKVEAERAIFKWAEDNNSEIVINTLQPNANIGQMLNSAEQGYPTSARWVPALFNHDYDSLKTVQPQHFVNVQDCARLHIIALAHPDVRSERIFAMTGPVNLNDIIKILRKIFPEKHFEDFQNDEQDLSTVEPIARAEQLLKEAYGTGFVGLEESVRANAADLVVG